MVTLGSPRLMKRLLYYRWITPLFSSRDPLYPFSRIVVAQKRMEAGEFPPLMPYEIREKAKRRPPCQLVVA